MCIRDSNTRVQTRVLFSPDSRYLASSHHGNPVRLWSVEGRLVRTFSEQASDISDFTFSSDSRILAVSNWTEHEIQLWSIEGSLLQTFGTRVEVYSVAVNPDGSMVAGGGAGKVWIWQTNNDTTVLKEPMITLQTGEDVRFLAFSADSKRIIAVSAPLIAQNAGATCRVWTVRGEPVRTFQIMDPLNWGQSVWYEFALNGSGRFLAYGTPQNRIQVCSLEGEPIISFDGYTGTIAGLAFSPDSNFVAAGSEDGELRIHNLQTGENVLMLVFKSGQWVIVHKTGRFACSDGARNYILFVDGLRVLDPEKSEKYWNALYTPDLLERFIKGEQLSAPSLSPH